MDEHIKREATIDAITDLAGKAPTRSAYEAVWKSARALKKIPAADVAPVVRCKDCEHAERYERADGTAGYYCGHPQNTFTYGEYWDRVFKPAKEADDYCSYGERKDGGDG